MWALRCSAVRNCVPQFTHLGWLSMCISISPVLWVVDLVSWWWMFYIVTEERKRSPCLCQIDGLDSRAVTSFHYQDRYLTSTNFYPLTCGRKQASEGPSAPKLWNQGLPWGSPSKYNFNLCNSEKNERSTLKCKAVDREKANESKTKQRAMGSESVTLCQMLYLQIQVLNKRHSLQQHNKVTGKPSFVKKRFFWEIIS